jgi:hypothetical protein
MQNTKNIRRAALGCAAALLIVTTSAWAGGERCHKPYQLGGAWVCFWAGTAQDGTPARIEFNATCAPLDAEGRSVAVKTEWMPVGKEFEALEALLNTHPSEAVGSATMIDRDTCKFTWIWYDISNDRPSVIRAIFVLSGEMTFQGPDKLIADTTIKVYLTNSGVEMVAPVVGGPWPYGDADANHDLLPDNGAVPFVQQAFPGAVMNRVPLLP